MATGIYPIQIDFSAGEIAENLGWKVQPPEVYGNGVASLANYWIRGDGGITRRPGTLFSFKTKYLSKQVRLESFNFGGDETAIFEIGHSYIRIYGSIEEPGDQNSLLQEIETEYTEQQINNLDFAQFGQLIYIVHGSHPVRLLERVAEDDYELTEVEFIDGPYLRSSDEITWSLEDFTDEIVLSSSFADEFEGVDIGDYVEYERDGLLFLGEVTGGVGTPNDSILVRPIENVVNVNDMAIDAYYRSADNEIYSAEAQFSQRLVGSWIKISPETEPGSGDPVAPTWKLIDRYTGITTVNLADYDGVHQNQTATTVQIDTCLAGDSITVTKWVEGDDGEPGYIGSVAVESRNIVARFVSSEDHALESATSIGRLIRLNFAGIQFWGKIVAIPAANEIQVHSTAGLPLNPDNQSEIANRGQSESYRLGAFFEGNYPRTSVFHDQRLIFGGTERNPQTIWASVLGDFQFFAPTDIDSTVRDDSAFSYDIARKRQSPIIWMNSGRTLVVGMKDAEGIVRGSTINETLTPNNIHILSETNIGSAEVQPTQLGSSLFFADQSGEQIMEYRYSFEIDSFLGTPTANINPAILLDGGGVRELVAVRSPWPMICAVLNNGQVACMTRPGGVQDFYPWHRTVISGAFDHENSHGVVESMAVEERQGEDDRIYAVVKRIGEAGTEERFVEYFGPVAKSKHSFDLREEVYADSAVIVEDTTTNLQNNNISGAAAHLVGHVDSPAVPADLVSNGEVFEDVGVEDDGDLTSLAFLDGDDETTYLVLGLKMRSLVMTLNPMLGTERGMSHVMRKRMTGFFVALLRSQSVGIGYRMDLDETSVVLDDLFRANYRLTPSDTRTTDAPRHLKTDLVEVELNQDYNRDIRIFLFEDRPVPQTILAMGSRITTQAR